MSEQPARDALLQRQHRYSAAAQRIERQILDGEISAGSRILGERDLARLMGISRVTLRRALNELKDRGILVSDEAKGWFVAPPNVSEQNVLRSFTEMAEAQGLTCRSRVLRKKVRPATFEEVKILRLVAGAKVFDLKRVRILANEPVGIENSIVPLQRAPELPEIDFSRSSLYAALREAGATPVIADYTLSAISADQEQAKLLRVKAGTALLAAHAIARDNVDTPVELSQTAFLGDRYRFMTSLRAQLR
jgi:GntR family transcriptional regulator